MKNVQHSIDSRNNGLIGDKFKELHICPTDSNTWIYSCDRPYCYITQNKGINWTILNYPEDADIYANYLFDEKGRLLFIDKNTIRVKSKNTWEKIYIPDSLTYGFYFYDRSHNFRFVLYPRIKHHDSYKALIYDDISLEKPLQEIIEERLIDTIKFNYKKYLFNKYRDTSFVSITRGHVLYSDLKTKIATKRMNGIHKPNIVGFLQDSIRPNNIRVIERNYVKFSGSYYYLYESYNFGEKWNLIDSSSYLRQLMDKNTAGTMGIKEVTDTLLTKNNQITTNLLNINDSLFLSQNWKALTMVNAIDKEKTDLIKSDNTIFNRFPNIDGFSYYSSSSLKGYIVPKYATKVTGDTLEIIFADTQGGVSYLKQEL